MDVLREFLESSTIHGLTYISTAQVEGVVITAIFQQSMELFFKTKLSYVVAVFWAMLTFLSISPRPN